MSKLEVVFKCPHCEDGTLIEAYKTVEHLYVDEMLTYDTESETLETETLNSCEPPTETPVWEFAYYLCSSCGAKWATDKELMDANALVKP
jgi:DNA-directed RNA polymerase subunit RPC12/RpoP